MRNDAPSFEAYHAEPARHATHPVVFETSVAATLMTPRRLLGGLLRGLGWLALGILWGALLWWLGA